MKEHILIEPAAGPAAEEQEAVVALEEADFRNTIQRKIAILHGRSRQGLWNIAVFLLISIVALLLRDMDLLAPFPEQIRVILGAPPAPFLIHIVLGISTVSALVIISGRVASGAEPVRRWEQVCYRSAFYLLYLLSNALDQVFPFVFATGMAVLLLEHYHIWRFFAKAIRHENELMRKISLWPLIAMPNR